MVNRAALHSWWQKKQDAKQQRIESAVSKMSVPEADAYWISPGGKLLPVIGYHISEVVNSPESFGFTEKQVKEIFKKHNEPMGFEGKARQEIMKNLIMVGWIRVRYYMKNDTYSVELNSLTKRIKDYLWAWASGVFEANNKRKYSEVKITEFSKDFYTSTYSIDDLIKEVLYSKAEKSSGVREQLIIIRSVYDMLSVAPPMRPELRV
jgi:hypothetical protein